VPKCGICRADHVGSRLYQNYRQCIQLLKVICLLLIFLFQEGSFKRKNPKKSVVDLVENSPEREALAAKKVFTFCWQSKILINSKQLIDGQNLVFWGLIV